MATKPNNIVKFYGEGYGTVLLVKKSLAYRLYSGGFTDPLTGIWMHRRFWYWQGQLVHRWEGKGPGQGERWGPFSKGRVVWLDAGIFHMVIDL